MKGRIWFILPYIRSERSIIFQIIQTWNLALALSRVRECVHSSCCNILLSLPLNFQVPIIGLVMGERGLISRILCAKFGGYLTFGTLEKGAVSAPGQPTIRDLLDLYNFRLIGPDTKVFGIIGNPVGHSKSPHMYNPAFKAVGFNGIYVPLLVDSVPNFLKTYSSPDFVGYRYYFLSSYFIEY